MFSQTKLKIEIAVTYPLHSYYASSFFFLPSFLPSQNIFLKFHKATMAKMKKFQVKLDNLKLYGYDKENERIAIEIKWKGPQRHSLLSVPFYAKSPLQINRTSAQPVLNNHHQWNHEFHSICAFEFPHHEDPSSIPFWDTKFYVLLVRFLI